MMVGIGVGVVLLVTVLVVAMMWVGAHNKEVGLRNAIVAKQKDNTSEFDNMFKKIAQSAQVTDAQKNALKEIFVAHAQARGGVGSGGIMKWLQESVPNVDMKTYENLQNIITASRNSWTMRQKELLDLSREHNDTLTKFPSSLFVGGRSKIEIQIVTSSRTEKAFESGKDEDIDVFQKK